MRHALLLILLLSTPLHAGSIHKWVDEDGNVHYGDAPPVSAKTESVRVQSAPSNPGKALPRLNNSGNAEDGSTTAADPEDPTVPKDQAKLACDQATDDLKVINNSARIKLRQNDGTVRYMTSDEITARKEQAEADIKRFCN